MIADLRQRVWKTFNGGSSEVVIMSGKQKKIKRLYSQTAINAFYYTSIYIALYDDKKKKKMIKTTKAAALTFGPHADGQAFFQPTLLAFAPHVHVDLAVVAVLALVHRVFGDTPPEEAFASFARERVVMVPGRPVAAH